MANRRTSAYDRPSHQSAANVGANLRHRPGPLSSFCRELRTLFGPSILMISAGTAPGFLSCRADHEVLRSAYRCRRCSRRVISVCGASGRSEWWEGEDHVAILSAPLFHATIGSRREPHVLPPRIASERQPLPHEPRLFPSPQQGVTGPTAGTNVEAHARRVRRPRSCLVAPIRRAPVRMSATWA
jgi:hypothetical protein